MPRNNTDPLDEQFGEVIMWIESNRPEVPPMPVGVKAVLRSHLTAQYSDHRRPIRSITVSLGVIAAVIIVGLLLWFASPRPISAAEIISRASLAAANADAFGLKSYSGIKISWMRNSAIDVQQGPLPPNLQEHIWAQMPDLLHDEWYSYPPGSQVSAGLPENPGTPATPDASIAIDLSSVIVNDGSSVWWYNVMGKFVVQHNPNTIFLPSLPKDMPSLPINFQSLLKQLGQTADNVTQLGTETVAGREAYVLSFNPKPDVSVYPFTTQIKVWIDTHTYFQLGQEYRDSQGLILYKWVYSEFKPNVDISPEMFRFTPPSDVLVVDVRAPKDAAALAVAWWTVALSADYKVFRPTHIPSGLIMERPYYGVLGGYSDGFTQLQQNFYADGGELPAFVLIEDKNVGQLSFPIGTSVKIDQYDGKYYEENGRRMLQMVRDDTWIFLEVDQQVITKADLFQIAQALELVSQKYPSDHA